MSSAGTVLGEMSPASRVLGDMSSAKRRKIFFSTHERSLLLNLVEARKQIIECKQTDYSTTEKKHQAWEDVAADFNSQTGVTMRNSKQLKKCWENAKAKAKKELADMHRETVTCMGRHGSDLPKPSDDCLRVMAIHRYRYKHTDFDDEDDEGPDKECAASESMCIAELQDCDYPKMELSTDSNQEVYRPGPSRVSIQDDTRPGGPVLNSKQDVSNMGPSRGSMHDSIYDDSRIHENMRAHPEVIQNSTTSNMHGSKEHHLAVQMLQEKRALQLEKHKYEIHLLKLKVENEKRIFKLKEENELRHRKILELQEVFWNSNLRNLLSADEDKSD